MAIVICSSGGYQTAHILARLATRNIMNTMEPLEYIADILQRKQVIPFDLRLNQ
jgi:hypothetical protein